MGTNTMTTYFTTDLDGSGQIVAVADAGLDEDHGDFGTRWWVTTTSSAMVQPLTGTQVTAPTWPAPCWGTASVAVMAGSHRPSTLLSGDGKRQHGNFQSPSLNNLLNTAYNAGARTHTNSWGSSAASQQAKYNSKPRTWTTEPTTMTATTTAFKA